jgi:hypothetical protein
MLFETALLPVKSTLWLVTPLFPRNVPTSLHGVTTQNMNPRSYFVIQNL